MAKRGRKPKTPGSLSTKALAALKVEIRFVNFNRPELFTMPAKRMADLLKVTSRSVNMWRANPNYQKKARQLLAERCKERYEDPALPRRLLGDPENDSFDETVEMIFTDGCWQEFKTVLDAAESDRRQLLRPRKKGGI